MSSRLGHLLENCSWGQNTTNDLSPEAVVFLACSPQTRSSEKDLLQVLRSEGKVPSQARASLVSSGLIRRLDQSLRKGLRPGPVRSHFGNGRNRTVHSPSLIGTLRPEGHPVLAWGCSRADWARGGIPLSASLPAAFSPYRSKPDSGLGPHLGSSQHRVSDLTCEITHV